MGTALKTGPKVGYCIYIDTFLEGPCPVEHDEQGCPIVYPTLLAAQRIIAEDTIERIHQFLLGEREFDDAMTVEEYVVKVDIQPDGSVYDQSGQRFGRV